MILRLFCLYPVVACRQSLAVGPTGAGRSRGWPSVLLLGIISLATSLCAEDDKTVLALADKDLRADHITMPLRVTGPADGQLRGAVSIRIEGLSLQAAAVEFQLQPAWADGPPILATLLAEGGASEGGTEMLLDTRASLLPSLGLRALIRLQRAELALVEPVPVEEGSPVQARWRLVLHQARIEEATLRRDDAWWPVDLSSEKLTIYLQAGISPQGDLIVPQLQSLELHGAPSRVGFQARGQEMLLIAQTVHLEADASGSMQVLRASKDAYLQVRGLAGEESSPGAE